MKIETIMSLARAAGIDAPEVPIRDRSKTRAYTPGYEPGGGGWRIRGYTPSNAGINTLVESGGDALVAWSRDQVRKNAYAANALETWTSNVVGTGIRPQFMHSNPKIRKRLSELWAQWVDAADANGALDFYGLQGLVCRASREAGEVITRKRFRRAGDVQTVPLQLQVLEAEHLPRRLNRDEPNGNVIRAGIEFNKIARREAYHLYRERPNERVLYPGAGDTVRVPADQVIHNFEVIRPGQHRGQPWFTPVLVKLYELDKYDSLEMQRKTVAAAITYLFEEDNPEDSVLEETIQSDDPAADGVAVGVIEAGSSVVLPRGLTAKPSSAADLTGQYEAFYKVNLRATAKGLGLTYFQLSGDMSDTTYSSSRIDLLEFRRRCERYQYQVMVFQFCRPVLRAWLEAAALAGEIDARDYTVNQAEYMKVEWRPPKWDWVDPEKDIKAEILMIDNLLKPRSATINELGYDEEQVDEQISVDQDREKKLGLIRRDGAANQAEEAEMPNNMPAVQGESARAVIQ